MFDKTIIVSEISPASDDMIKCMEGLKTLGVKKCLVVQYFNPGEIEVGVSEYLRDIFQENLRKQEAVLKTQGFEVETRIVTGNMKNEINRLAVEEGFDLIVVGGGKHTFLGALIFGEIAYDVISHAKRPVLLVRSLDTSDEEVVSTKKSDILEHILFPTDFSDNADIAFEYVKEMVRNGVGKVTLLHVQDQLVIQPYLLHRLLEFNEIDKERLEKYKDELLAYGEVEVEIEISFGSPIAEIMSVIDCKKIPLVVMGTQGRGYIKEVFLGSVSHNIARHASASILLIPGNQK